MNYQIKIIGDSAVSVQFGEEISETIHYRIQAFQAALTAMSLSGLVEMVPTYCTLMVHYDPEQISYCELCGFVSQAARSVCSTSRHTSRTVELPVLYGGEHGPDLQFVADYNHLSIEEVVRIHTSGNYLTYMLGFTPGFPYLGGMDDRIAAPRLKTPRVSIPVGSVGIAGTQTGVYPLATPGGWQLIGRTPVRLYDPDRSEPTLIRAGDRIRFRDISDDEYRAISEQVEAGTYICPIVSDTEVSL